MVLQYCVKHVDADAAAGKENITGDKLKDWDDLFVKVDQNTLVDLIWVSSFFQFKILRLPSSCSWISVVF